MFRNFLNVGAMTLLSRLLGFARDMLMASVLGTGLAADAFFAAFRFPNLFRRLFAEGAFNAAFIPLFSGALETKGEDAARELAAHIISWLFVFLVVLTIVAEIFMPLVLVPFVPGFLEDPQKFELTVLLTRICFPYLAAMSLMAAYGGILNGLRRFLAAAFAPVLLNIVLVGFLAAIVLFGARNPLTSAMWLAWGTLLGGAAQLALVYWAVRRTGFMPRFSRPRLGPDVRRFWVLALPAIASGGITQINIFIGTIIASSQAAAISYLYYADRLYQLPLGIIGIAIGVVLLPELSRHLKARRHEAAEQAMSQSLSMSMLLALPATAGLMALALPIISTLYQRGAFDAAAAGATAAALVAFAAGLPAFILIKLFQPGFFAREDTATPTWFSAISVGINILLSLTLFPLIGHVGIAIATSASAWANATLLGFSLWRRGHFHPKTGEMMRLGAMAAISLVLAFLLLVLRHLAHAPLAGVYGSVVQMGTLGLIVGVGVVGYFAAIHLSGVINLRLAMARLRRTGKKQAKGQTP